MFVDLGGVIDRVHQNLVLFLMILTAEDVSKVRFGGLTQGSIQTLRLLKDAFGVVFRITKDVQYEVLDNVERKSTSSVKYVDEESSDGETEEDMDQDDEEVDYGDPQDDDGNDEGMVEDDDDDDMEQESDDADELDDRSKKVERVTYLLSCLGIGYSNVNRRAT